jgi:hypothetical protein
LLGLDGLERLGEAVGHAVVLGDVHSDDVEGMHKMLVELADERWTRSVDFPQCMLGGEYQKWTWSRGLRRWASSGARTPRMQSRHEDVGRTVSGSLRLLLRIPLR